MDYRCSSFSDSKENIEGQILKLDLYHILEYCVRFMSIQYFIDFGYEYNKILDRKELINLIVDKIQKDWIKTFIKDLYGNDNFHRLDKIYKKIFEYIEYLKDNAIAKT